MKTLKELHSELLLKNTAQIIEENHDLEKLSLPTVHIYFLMNHVINTIDPYLKWYLLQSGFKPNIVYGQYDNIHQEILNPNSSLYTHSYDLILVSIYHAFFDANFLSRLNKINDIIEECEKIISLIKQNTTSLIGFNTQILPFYSEKIVHEETGNYLSAFREINRFIYEYAKTSTQFILFDWERYIAHLGEEASLDYRNAYLFKAPFKKGFLSYYAKDITSTMRSLHAKYKKCLILDCDETLWGGILGEEGEDGIDLNPHDYPGKLFFDFQRSILSLKEKGIMITLCSKNNEKDVLHVLNHHPYSLIKQDDLTAYRINWQNKADNIKEMIQQLNISLSHCVFMDDSPYECHLVKEQLPDVTVLQVKPRENYAYATLLAESGLFDTLNLSEDDKNRHHYYQAEIKRQESQKSMTNLSAYLHSLKLSASIHELRSSDLSRAAQLTQKTNQFNLSTKRYTEEHLSALLNNPVMKIYTLKPFDKFGDYGLTGVIIVERLKNKIVLDSFLLSCRILSRNLEHFFLKQVLNFLHHEEPFDVCLANYHMSLKNQPVLHFLVSSGFQQNDDGQYFIHSGKWQHYEVDHIQFKEC